MAFKITLAARFCNFCNLHSSLLRQLPVIRQDWPGISTFGQRSQDTRLRDVVDIKVSPVGGQKVIQIEAYVSEISTIQNGHVELAKGEYPHPKDLWFSDVSKGSDELVIDVVVGAGYLWNFQKECTIRRKPDESVAVETELEWVLSRSMKGQVSGDIQLTQVNVITSVRDERFQGEVHKLWDLKTLGISPLKDEILKNSGKAFPLTGVARSE